MSGYFSFFPSLLYANTAASNLIAKVEFDQAVFKRAATYYPYTVLNDERPDQIAENYYGDASYDWIIYLGNSIIDPLNEWPKSENVFNDFLTLKYGSVANTIQQTAFYQVSYDLDDRVLSTSTYNDLSAGQKKYWSPNINNQNQVINYQRKQLDTVVETNQIVMLTGTFSGINVSNVIDQSSSVYGTVAFSNSSTLMLKHVVGTWTNASPVYFKSSGALANATIATANIVNQTIPLDEIPYWSPVTVYQNESLINENRKHIKLLNSAYVNHVERDMKDLLG